MNNDLISRSALLEWLKDFAKDEGSKAIYGEKLDSIRKGAEDE